MSKTVARSPKVSRTDGLAFHSCDRRQMLRWSTTALTLGGLGAGMMMPARLERGTREAVASEPMVRTGIAADPKNEPPARPPAQIAITLDLEMSAQYPRRDIVEWNYEKGNLDEATKRYALEAARIVREAGGVIHFFCVGRVLEQPDTRWLEEIAAMGHPIGNHTYDHVNVKAKTLADLQFRFQRAPWLVEGLKPLDVIRQNIRLTTVGLASRAKIAVQGFRTPGGFHNGLDDAPEVQDLLKELGFAWVSSKYPAHPAGQPRVAPDESVYRGIVAAQQAAQPFVYPSGLVEIPMSPISDVNAFRSHYWKLDYFLRAVGDAVDWAIAAGKTFDFLAHPSCLVVEDPEWRTIKMICDKVAQAGPRAELVGLDRIAARVAK